jgi:hypothetical protein
MPCRFPLLPAVVCAIALVASTGVTRARASETEADSAITSGIALRREHRDAEALVEFRRAYALTPTPRALAQIALAEAALAQWVTAEADLLRAMASQDTPIVSQLGALRMALSEIQRHLGTIDVRGPVGAELSIGGVLVGQLPLPRARVPAEHVVVELRAPGFHPERREVDVAPNANVELELWPQHVDGAHEEATIAVPKAAAEIAAPPREAPPTPRRESSTDRTAAWIAGGGAVAFLVAAGIMTAYEADLVAHYNDNVSCGDLPGMPRSVRCASTADEFHTAQTLALSGYALAAASAITSAVLFITASPRRDARSVSAGCAPTVGGLACLARF